MDTDRSDLAVWGSEFGRPPLGENRTGRDPVHINDFHATMLHLFGLDHLRLTHRFQGRDFRLTDVGGQVIQPWTA